MQTREKPDKKFSKSFTSGWIKSQIQLELFINESQLTLSSPSAITPTPLEITGSKSGYNVSR
jgi:hypothetical protein